MLPEEVDARLRREARRRGASMADVARSLLDSHLPPTPVEGRLGFFSVGDGDPPDASEHVDELVNDALIRRDR